VVTDGYRGDREELQRRIDELQAENRILKMAIAASIAMEMKTEKTKLKGFPFERALDFVFYTGCFAMLAVWAMMIINKVT
jgi:hypothetical protein